MSSLLAAVDFNELGWEIQKELLCTIRLFGEESRPQSSHEKWSEYIDILKYL
jgi:hypothetical protein